MKKRDGNILKNFKREINLSTKVLKNKKIYTRKCKFKKDLRYFVV